MTDTQACDRMKAWFEMLHEQMRLELKEAREVLGV